MTKILRIAARDFMATVLTKGFLIGLVLPPAIGVVMAIAAPRLFDESNFQVEGVYAVVDPTGQVHPSWRPR